MVTGSVPSRLRQVAIGAGVGLLSAVVGAGLSAGLFLAVYHPHGGGDIGDWTAVAFGIGAFVIGLPLGLLAGIGWSFTAQPRWRLLAIFAAGGLLAAVIGLANSRH